MKIKRILFKEMLYASLKRKGIIIIALYLVLLFVLFPLFYEKNTGKQKIMFDPYYIEERYKAENDLQEMIWEAGKTDAPFDIYESIYQLKIEVCFYQTADRLGLDIYNEEFIADTLHDYASLCVQKDGLSATPDEFLFDDQLLIKEKILENHDFALYIQEKIKDIENSDDSETEKEAKTEKYNLQLLAYPENDIYLSHVKNAINDAVNIKKSILTQKDYYRTGNLSDLSKEDIKELQNEYDTLLFRIEHGILTPETDVDTPFVSLITFEVFSLILAVFFANSVLRDLNTQTLKFYITLNISRRSYFYVRLSVFVVTVFGLSLVSGASSAFLTKIFSPSFAVPYVLNISGKMLVIPFFVQTLMKFFFLFLKSVFYYSVVLLVSEFVRSQTISSIIGALIFCAEKIKDFIPNFAKNRIFSLIEPAESVFCYDFGDKFAGAPTFIPALFTLAFSLLMIELAFNIFKYSDI